MCKEMPVIPVDRVVDKKRIIGNKNGGPRRRRGTRGRRPTKSNAVLKSGFTCIEKERRRKIEKNS
jgi:hypothetical protein